MIAMTGPYCNGMGPTTAPNMFKHSETCFQRTKPCISKRASMYTIGITLIGVAGSACYDITLHFLIYISFSVVEKFKILSLSMMKMRYQRKRENKEMGYYLFYIFGRTEGGLNTIICLKYENLNVYMLYILTIR